MKALGYLLQLADSELAGAQWLDAAAADSAGPGPVLQLRFSAAWLQPVDEPGRSGLASLVQLLLWGVQPRPDLAQALGRIRSGRLQQAGQWRGMLLLGQTLQASAAQPLLLELDFALGDHWALRLQALRCDGPAEPQLRESLAC